MEFKHLYSHSAPLKDQKYDFKTDHITRKRTLSLKDSLKHLESGHLT